MTTLLCSSMYHKLRNPKSFINFMRKKTRNISRHTIPIIYRQVWWIDVWGTRFPFLYVDWCDFNYNRQDIYYSCNVYTSNVFDGEMTFQIAQVLFTSVQNILRYFFATCVWYTTQFIDNLSGCRTTTYDNNVCRYLHIDGNPRQVSHTISYFGPTRSFFPFPMNNPCFILIGSFTLSQRKSHPLRLCLHMHLYTTRSVRLHNS